MEDTITATDVVSSSTKPAFKYDVFLSFRGEDTRHNFTGHLYDSLRERKIKTYIDDKELARGDEILKALKKAIDAAKLSVIIFSKNYASSPWCLDELVHILECREKSKQIVLPVFYRIDPSNVRNQKGSYESAFAIHEERFRNKMDKVQRWRVALRAASNIAGWNSNVTRRDSSLVDIIVKDILSKLNHTAPPDDFEDLVGITKRTVQIESLLRFGSGVWKVGIWGIGGIGKTTLARVVFDRLSNEFESSCFLANIREEWGNGQKYDLKKRLFSALLEENNPNIGTLSVGSTYDTNRLCNKKVLIVLDDVDDSEQLKFFVKTNVKLGPGSRIIITTRNMQVLRKKVDKIYNVEALNYEEALVLFQSNAFEGTPPKDLLHLSERVIKLSEGIPLALEVLGSFLGGQEHENWKEVLDKLKECPYDRIQSVLRISYDGLDKMQKCIFLDIACFFKGMRRDCVERILGACRLFPKSGIDDLVDKSLITIKDDNILWMHDLVQEMGWEIERSIGELPRRCRLWNPEDVSLLLKTNIGATAIEGVVLDMSNMTEVVHVDPAAFKNMYKLRLLKIFCSNNFNKCEVCIPPGYDDLQFLPDSLRYLHWEGYPWKSVPSSFTPQDLVELNLPCSKLNELWEGSQPNLGSLKKIDLSYSKELTGLPDLCGASKLEHVYLEYCPRLQEIPSYFQDLRELKTLMLEGCSSVREFPKVSKSIVCLVLSRTSIERVPLSIEHLSCLEILILNYCKKLKSLPCHIRMESLTAITLEGTEVSRPHWIQNVVEHSQLSLYQLHKAKNRVFLRPEDPPELKSLPELPLFGSYIGSDMYVETVSISVANLCLQNPDSLRIRGGNFLFYNCLPLYGKGRNTKTSVPELKILSARITSREFSTGHSNEADIGVFCEGKGMPYWFHYKLLKKRGNEKLNLVIDLPPNSLNPNFLGFAVCASFIINPFVLHQKQKVKLLCKPHFIMKNGCILSWDFNSYDGSDYPNARALEEDWLNAQKKIAKIAFQFSLSLDQSRPDGYGSGMMCGIHLLYKEDYLQNLKDLKLKGLDEFIIQESALEPGTTVHSPILQVESVGTTAASTLSLKAPLNGGHRPQIRVSSGPLNKSISPSMRVSREKIETRNYFAESSAKRSSTCQLLAPAEVKSHPRLPILFSFNEAPDMYLQMVSVSTQVLQSYRTSEFLFYNCLQLYGRGQNNETQKLERISGKIAFQDFPSYGPVEADIGVCSPGKVIPRRFYPRYSQTSANDRMMNVEIGLHLKSPRSSLLGFAVCASVEMYVPPHYDLHLCDGIQQVRLLCKPHFIMKNGRNWPWDLNSYGEFGYPHLGDWLTVRKGITKVAFEFSLYPNTRNDHYGWRIKECGICCLNEKNFHSP